MLVLDNKENVKHLADSRRAGENQAKESEKEERSEEMEKHRKEKETKNTLD